MAKIVDRIHSLPPDAFFFSLEFFPPKTAAGFQNLLPRLHRLRVLQPLFVCVTFSAGGTTASKSLELADICQNQLGLTTCLHLTCTNLRRGTIDTVLDECKKLGIQNILALRGDEPRDGEYAGINGVKSEDLNGIKEEDIDADDVHFSHAVDLIQYIRKKHGSYFCIGAAAYPEGHPTVSAEHPGGIFQSPEQDLPHLVEKVRGGADFFLTQLFYDVEKYLAFETMLRTHESSAFESIPIIPGLMPIQGWQSFSRTCKLARVGLPSNIQEKFHSLRGDDEGVKDMGVKIVSEIVKRIRKEACRSPDTSTQRSTAASRQIPQGFHFYTLNLEKAVAQILERSELLPVPPAEPVPNGNHLRQTRHEDVTINVDPPSPVNGAIDIPHDKNSTKKKRRSSSVHNRVIVTLPSTSPDDKEYLVLQDEVRAPTDDVVDEAKDGKDALAMSEGEGSLGREATWDDFPNGRWGDARSPAYGSANNYTLHPQLAPSNALSLWEHPTTAADITSIFRRYMNGSLPSNPWSEEGLSPETQIISKQLLALNEKGWWTVASQPAVNACPSGDEVFGWGPRSGGWVWQKPFVEFFLPKDGWVKLKERLSKLVANEEITYLAGSAFGDFESSDEGSVNPVTWGAFKGKEIITPTIIEPTSFLAWREEAFAIWREWARVFPPSSPSAKLLQGLSEDLWLVNVIGHDYVDGGKLWDVLLE